MRQPLSNRYPHKTRMIARDIRNRREAQTLSFLFSLSLAIIGLSIGWALVS